MCGHGSEAPGAGQGFPESAQLADGSSAGSSDLGCFLAACPVSFLPLTFPNSAQGLRRLFYILGFYSSGKTSGLDPFV